MRRAPFTSTRERGGAARREDEVAARERVDGPLQARRLRAGRDVARQLPEHGPAPACPSISSTSLPTARMSSRSRTPEMVLRYETSFRSRFARYDAAVDQPQPESERHLRQPRGRRQQEVPVGERGRAAAHPIVEAKRIVLALDAPAPRPRRRRGAGGSRTARPVGTGRASGPSPGRRRTASPARRAPRRRAARAGGASRAAGPRRWLSSARAGRRLARVGAQEDPGAGAESAGPSRPVRRRVALIMDELGASVPHLGATPSARILAAPPRAGQQPCKRARGRPARDPGRPEEGGDRSAVEPARRRLSSADERGQEEAVRAVAVRQQLERVPARSQRAPRARRRGPRRAVRA